MKVHKSTQKIVELWQRDWNGNLIHVYQIDTPEFTPNREIDRALTLPIIVDGGGVQGISIENLLGDRKKYLDKISKLEDEIKEQQERITELLDKLLTDNPKRWYQFWKKNQD